METFIPYILNQAERDKDSSKILTLGPYAYALKIITQFAQNNRK
jgi:hypothetical protein